MPKNIHPKVFNMTIAGALASVGVLIAAHFGIIIPIGEALTVVTGIAAVVGYQTPSGNPPA